MKTLLLRLTTASAACAMLFLISCQELPIDPWDPGNGGGGGPDTSWNGGGGWGDTTWHGGGGWGDTTWHGGGGCDTVIDGDTVIIIRR